jgi:hypothetical protein
MSAEQVRAELGRPGDTIPLGATLVDGKIPRRRLAKGRSLISATAVAVACIASLGLVGAALAYAGRYHVTTIQSGAQYVMMVDRFTGTAYSCNITVCEQIPRSSKNVDQRDSGANDRIVPRK